MARREQNSSPMLPPGITDRRVLFLFNLPDWRAAADVQFTKSSTNSWVEIASVAQRLDIRVAPRRHRFASRQSLPSMQFPPNSIS
jgi:hypothetical protein